MPDPEIRTGGHKRLSNFLLWQLAYTELFFLNKLWPDFKISDLSKIINEFKKVKEILPYMISQNLKNRILTSLFLLLLVFLILNYNFILVYSCIVLGVLSFLEFYNYQ